MSDQDDDLFRAIEQFKARKKQANVWKERYESSQRKIEKYRTLVSELLQEVDDIVPDWEKKCEEIEPKLKQYRQAVSDILPRDTVSPVQIKDNSDEDSRSPKKDAISAINLDEETNNFSAVKVSEKVDVDHDDTNTHKPISSSSIHKEIELEETKSLATKSLETNFIAPELSESKLSGTKLSVPNLPDPSNTVPFQRFRKRFRDEETHEEKNDSQKSKRLKRIESLVQGQWITKPKEEDSQRAWKERFIWDSILNCFKRTPGNFITEKEILRDTSKVALFPDTISRKDIDLYFSQAEQTSDNTEDVEAMRVKAVNNNNNKSWIVFLPSWVNQTHQ